MADDLVCVETSGACATLTLNRPGRLNALTRDLMLELRAALEQVAGDDAIRAVCLTGAGRGFCAGQDLSERDPRGRDTPFDLEAIQKELFHPVVTLIQDMPKPVLAQVNGIAAGAGVGLALAADIVIAGASARFTQSFVKVGLSVDAGGGLALVEALGVPRAKAALMLGETLDAAQAAAIGLIWKQVPDEALADTAQQTLEQLAAAPSTAMQSIKAAVTAATTTPDRQSYLIEEARLQGQAGAHPDYSEGVLSFLEKRKPRFL